jgi:tetratricopeptide (TPR) repeat protein
MAKSKLNLRFIGIFLAILVIGAGLVGFALYWQRVAGPERNFAAGERYLKEGDYRKAIGFFGRAVNRRQTEVRYLDALDQALTKFVPATTDEGRDYYNQLIGVRLQRARATPEDPAPWLRAMQTLYDRNNVFNADVLWREFSTEAEGVAQRIPSTDPAQNQLKYWKAIGALRRADTITEQERQDSERLLEEVVAADPSMEDAWLDLLRSQEMGAEKLISDQRVADARRRFEQFDATLERARKAIPNSYAWRVAALSRLRGRLDRREPGVTPEQVEDARKGVSDVAESVLDDRSKTLQIAAELLNARSNAWLDRVISLLEERIRRHPEDMVARRLLMIAATQSKPDLASEVAEETRGMPNLPVSLESLVQDEARMYAVMTLFNTMFEKWRQQSDEAKRAAMLPQMASMRDEAVKFLESIGERGTSQLIQAKAAIAENRVPDAVALFDGILKGQAAPPPDAYLYAAFANLARREAGSAMRVANEGVERYPVYTPLLMMRGEIEAATGRYDQARKTYERVLEIDASMKMARDKLEGLRGMETTAAGAAMANQGDAIAALLGSTERKLLARDLDGAEADLLAGYKTIKADPRDPRLVVALAQFYALVRNDPVKAQEWIEKGLAIQPNEERLLQFKAVLSSKDPVDRVLEGVRLQYPDPRAQAVYRYLALSDLVRQLDESLQAPGVAEADRAAGLASQERARSMMPKALDEALAADPRSEALLERSALDAVQRKDWQTTERIAGVADGIGERGIGATLRARALLAQDKQTEALQLLETARKSGDESPMLLRQICVLLERAGRLEEAVEAIRLAYDRRPNEINTARLYAVMLDRSGQRTRALDILRELARANPTNRDTMDAWLSIEAQVGDRTGAVAMRRRLYNDAPGFRANSMALAQLLLENPGDPAIMLDAEGRRKFTNEKLQAMAPLTRTRELQQAAQANVDLGMQIVELLQKQSPDDPMLALMKARALARFGQVKEGEASLRADIAKVEGAAALRLWLSLGAYLAENGQPERSSEPFAQAIKLQDPATRNGEIQISDFWFNRQQWKRAREVLEPVVASLSGEGQAGLALRLAEICQNLRDYEAAVRNVDLAEKTLGDSNGTVALLRAAILGGRAEAAMAAGDGNLAAESAEKSVATYRRATEIAPNSVVAWAGLADAERNAFLRTRDAARLEAAEKAADRSLSLLSTYLPAIRVKKDVLLDRNELNGAIALIDQFVRSAPQSQDGRRLLIELLMRSGNQVRAITVAEEAAQIEPRSPEWPTIIATINQSQGKEQEATAAFDRAFATDSNEETLMRAVNSRVQRKEADWAGVVTQLRANPKVVSTSPALQCALGAALVNSKQRDAGLQALRNAHTTIRDGIAKGAYPPGTWDLWYRAMAQAFTERPQEGEAFARSALAGKAPDFHHLRGFSTVWRQQGKAGADPAIKFLEEAAASAKDDPQLASSAFIEAGEIAYVMGDCQRSLPLFERAIALVPDSAPALNNAAFVTAKCGNAPEKAVAWATKAVELAPQVADLQDTLGYVLLKSGKPQEALAPLQRAVTMSPTASPILHLAEALASAGRKDEARATLDRLGTMKLNEEQVADRDRITKSLQ